MRINKDEWGLRLAEVTALRGTCLRRQVGCVLVDFRGHVVATGYNGVPQGMPHCNEVTSRYPNGTAIWGNACPAAHAASGTQLGGCEATHAEINALVQCRDTQAIHTAYVTASPCIDCVKALMNTSCSRVVFRQVYPHPRAREMWIARDRVHFQWIHLPGEER